jgi:hypothetical protein
VEQLLSVRRLVPAAATLGLRTMIRPALGSSGRAPYNDVENGYRF